MITETMESPLAAVDMLSTVADGMADEQLWQLGDDQLLARMDQLGTLIDRLHGIRHRMIAEVEHRKACQDQEWTTADRLADTDGQPLRQARAMVKQAERLNRFPLISDALCAGTVTTAQAGAITHALDELPATVTDETRVQAQQEMIGHAGQFDPAALRRLGNHLVEVLCPDAVEDRVGQQLSRQDAKARRDRYLDWRHTGDGTLTLHGKLPAPDGDTFTTLIHAYQKHGQSGRDADQPDQTDGAAGQPDQSDSGEGPDRMAEQRATGQRRADALVAMLGDVQHKQVAPSVSGDRPRAVITVQYQDLIAGIRGATLLGSGEPVSAGVARQVACSGELLPAVLGGPSTVLDMARPVRLFTGQLRQALTLRDGGCVFPGCHIPPAGCEAHHVQPWWAGGTTSLDNGVLLCPHHHRLAEPDSNAAAGSRWTLHMDDHRLPQLIPPTHIDPNQKPRQHSRYTERQHTQPP